VDNILSEVEKEIIVSREKVKKTLFAPCKSQRRSPRRQGGCPHQGGKSLQSAISSLPLPTRGNHPQEGVEGDPLRRKKVNDYFSPSCKSRTRSQGDRREGPHQEGEVSNLFLTSSKWENILKKGEKESIIRRERVSNIFPPYAHLLKTF
jgi:hypothetical protein